TAAQRLGRPVAYLLGRDIHDFMPPELAQSRRQYLKQAVQSGQEARFRDQRGDRYFDHHHCPITDDQGRVSQVAVFAVDITDSVRTQERLAQALEGLEATVRERTRELREEITQRQAAQEALEESQQRLRRAVQWAPLPMMIHAEDGEVLLVNDAWRELSGYTQADIPTVERWADLAYGPGQEWIKKAIYKLYHLDRHLDAGEFQVRAKDGRLLIWHFSGASLGTGADGRRLAISVAMDVTQRRQDEEALRLERRRLSSVIAGTNIGTWEWNVQTGHTVYNQRWAEMLGHTLEELAPLSIQTWLDLAHPQDLAASNELVRKHFAGELDYYDCECRVRHKDGHWVWVHDRGKVVEWTAEGQPLIMSGTHADITQRKQAEEKISSLARFPSENPNPVMRFTAEGSLLYANEAAASLLRKLWAGRDDREEQPRSFRDAASWALATGQLQTAEVQAGDDIYTLTFVPVAGAGYVNVYGMDITGRKRAEESIRVLAKFPDENPNPVLRVSAQGVINYANQACQRCLGADNCQVGQAAPAILAPGLELERAAGEGGEFEVEVSGRTFLFSAAPISETGDIYLYGRDVTERRQLEHQRQMAGVVFDNSLEGIIIADPQGKVQMVNAAYTGITGYEASEIIGKDLNVFRSEQDDQAFYQELWEGLTHRGRWSGEYWNRRKDGEAYPEWINVVLVRDTQGNIANFVVIFHDITDIKSKEERIKHQAYHDALTGLPNRVLFNDRLGQAIAHAEREGSRLAVAFLDLDNFKRVNDSLGHQAGDQLLQETARRLKSCLRETDTVSRLGGDEFTIILPEASRPQATMEVTSRIVGALAQPFLIQGHELFITTSMGITFYPDDAKDAEGLLKNADMAMYRAKDQGRNNVQLFTPALNTEMQHRLRLESQLRQALERDEFILHYQPKLDVASGLVVGMEALVRWQRPGQGLAMPGSFIALAEETGLILPMGEVVLAKACQQTQAWRQTGHPYLCVSVNLSPRQFEQENLVEMVEGILGQTGLPSVCLELEITEGAMMKSVEKALAKLVGLASMGVRLSLDDFGTGYSSLSYLKRFSLSSLKIDQTFVRDLTVDANDAAIVQTIIAMGHALGLQVVAEGVETLEQLSFLRTHGCDEYQGYYFSRPLAPERFLALLTGAPLA
ncbi:MAG: EAL domain-containing protein, partial [Desulfarculus sp.]|nr:EAL domain-containing protein [Desulfarculus sp.]